MGDDTTRPTTAVFCSESAAAPFRPHATASHFCLIYVPYARGAMMLVQPTQSTSQEG